MNNDFKEAPASANVRVKTQNGFEWQFTMRDETVKELIVKIVTMEKIFKEKNWIPSIRQTFGKKEKVYVVGRVCPKDQGRLVESETKVGKVIKCENNKYDFVTKTQSGCSYVEWPDKGGK